MNTQTNDFNGWLQSKSETRRLAIVGVIVFGGLQGAVSLGLVSLNIGRTIALLILGIVAMTRLPAIIARAKPPVIVTGATGHPGPIR